jgi:hypothetical protein
MQAAISYQPVASSQQPAAISQQPVAGFLVPCIDFPDRNGQLFAIFDFVDSSIPNPDHLIGDIEHLKIMGCRYYRDIAFLAQAFE